MDVAVVDDDEMIIRQLKAYFERYSDEEKTPVDVVSYTNPNQLLMDYRRQFDLVCLDIDMPQMTGLETAEAIRRIDDDVLIIFITNLAQYALNAYKVNAIDYILKPLKYGDFKMKISKAMKYVRQKEGDVIPFTIDGQIYMVDTGSVLYLEVMTHYVTVHMKNKELTMRASLNSIEGMFPKSFARCANAYLVNLKYIEEVTASSVVLRNGTELPLTRSRKNEFMKAFASYMSGLK